MTPSKCVLTWIVLFGFISGFLLGLSSKDAHAIFEKGSRVRSALMIDTTTIRESAILSGDSAETGKLNEERTSAKGFQLTDSTTKASKCGEDADDHKVSELELLREAKERLHGMGFYEHQSLNLDNQTAVAIRDWLQGKLGSITDLVYDKVQGGRHKFNMPPKHVDKPFVLKALNRHFWVCSHIFFDDLKEYNSKISYWKDTRMRWRMGGVYSFLGSESQVPHADKNLYLGPPEYCKVSIYLADVLGNEHGPLEVWPFSHAFFYEPTNLLDSEERFAVCNYHHLTQGFSGSAIQTGWNVTSNAPVASYTAKMVKKWAGFAQAYPGKRLIGPAGTTIIRDSRLLHRGRKVCAALPYTRWMFEITVTRRGPPPTRPVCS
mmetsp:Transcript_34044/g.74465  ORF Transcript_34044/g.74465 Transcript_34044/m.74465 type:complete len:377 (-) Transcript_34044:505-1635(-)